MPQPVEEGFYIGSYKQRNKVIEFIKKSPDEIWKWTNTNPKGMRIFKQQQILGAALQRVKSIQNGSNSFVGISKQFKEDNKNILHKLSQHGPYTDDQLSSIFDMLQYVKPKGSEFRVKPESNETMIEFIKHSLDHQWMWIISNPGGILYFANSAEVLAAVLQRIKGFYIRKLISFPAVIQQFEKEDRSILR